MKACVLHAIADLRYEEVDAPTPKSGEVLIKVRASGVCGSDSSRVYKNGTYNFPTILGHEFSGEIIETGAGISSSYIGKKCAVFPLLPCRECDMCELGEYASCRNYNYFGSRCDGGFAEYIAVPFWNLVFADTDLTFEKMAMLEPAAVSIHSLGRAGIEFADTVAIFGAGPIGLMLAEFSAAWGADRIILLDIDQRKLDFARKLGYKYTINPKNETYVENVIDITSGRGVDLSIEGAGASSSLAGCLKLTKPQGKVVLMGNPLDDIQIAQKDYWEILRKQLCVFGTWNSSYTQKKNDWQIAMNAISSGKIDVSSIITHRFKLEECEKAFEMFKNKKEFYSKVMFTID